MLSLVWNLSKTVLGVDAVLLSVSSSGFQNVFNILGSNRLLPGSPRSLPRASSFLFFSCGRSHGLWGLCRTDNIDSFQCQRRVVSSCASVYTSNRLKPVRQRASAQKCCLSLTVYRAHCVNLKHSRLCFIAIRSHVDYVQPCTPLCTDEEEPSPTFSVCPRIRLRVPADNSWPPGEASEITEDQPLRYEAFGRQFHGRAPAVNCLYRQILGSGEGYGTPRMVKFLDWSTHFRRSASGIQTAVAELRSLGPCSASRCFLQRKCSCKHKSTNGSLRLFVADVLRRLGTAG